MPTSEHRDGTVPPTRDTWGSVFKPHYACGRPCRQEPHEPRSKEVVQSQESCVAITDWVAAPEGGPSWPPATSSNEWGTLMDEEESGGPTSSPQSAVLVPVLPAGHAPHGEP